MNNKMNYCVGVVFTVCASNTFASTPKMVAHFIDVGQADATLLEFPCGAVLIDAGAEDAH